jgi:hypothetical protein
MPKTELGKLESVYSSLTHPLEMIVANEWMFDTSGILYVAGGATFTAATGTAALGVYFFKNVTLPAIKEWGCPD